MHFVGFVGVRVVLFRLVKSNMRMFYNARVTKKRHEAAGVAQGMPAKPYA